MSLKERLYRFRSFWIFPPIAVVLFITGFQAEPFRARIDLLWLFLIGILVWSLLEYGLHRFLFHVRIPLRDPHLRDVVNSSHLLHHAMPRDREKVLVRPTFGLVISVILYGVLYALTRSPLSTAAILAGIWTGFLYYETVHYRVHFSLAGSGLVARQRKTHFYHHFTNNKRCFGVTTPLWDYVFGTALPRNL
jgi:sterol desaturase/sphingolipid hydroxylase (fatty acid hydroxylase superfamily)